MPNPTTAAEWAEKCNGDYLTGMRVEGKSNGHQRHGLCPYCAESCAHQQVAAALEVANRHAEADADQLVYHAVEAFRERTIKQVEAYLGVIYEAVPRDALKGYLIDAIRAVKETG